MAAIRKFIPKFGKEVLIDEDHPLALAADVEAPKAKEPPAAKPAKDTKDANAKTATSSGG